MSTITAHPGPAVRFARESSRSTGTTLRLTARGRRVLALLAALPAVVALSFAIIAGGSAVASRDAAPGETYQTFESVTVMSGETLWSIAGDVAPAADPRDVVDAIVRLNGLEGVEVLAGQQIAIPAEFDSIP